MKDVTVKCRVCGRNASASSFVLDYTHRMMVCPMCIQERKMSEDVKAEVKANRDQKKKPKDPVTKGYDNSDVALERAYAEKMKNTVPVEMIDEDSVRYVCPRCHYGFAYDMTKRTPAKCPYCSTSVGKIRY